MGCSAGCLEIGKKKLVTLINIGRKEREVNGGG